MKTRYVLLAALVPFLLTGCGGDEKEETSQEPTTQVTPEATSEPDATQTPPPAADEPPACSEVWVLGETLPDDYSGCLENGQETANIGFPCETGTGTLYAYEDPDTGEDKYFAVSGNEIGDSADDQAYEEAYNGCL